MKPRKTHRGRFSITHLSSETTATLPEYVPPSPKRAIHTQRQRINATPAALPPPKMIDSAELEGPPSDQPPEYPDSADEADEETDFAPGSDGMVMVYHGTPVLPSSAAAPTTPFPRRFHSTSAKPYSSSLSPPGRYTSTHNYHQHYHYTHPHRHVHQPPHRPRRFKSAAVHGHPYSSLSSSPTDDPYLDSLLERSVHALEMSNTLLQSTQTSHSALTSTPSLDEAGDGTDSRRHMDGEAEEVMDMFEERAMGLTKRIHVHEKRRERWVDDLEKITQDVERLFGDGDPEGDRDDSWEAGSSGARGRHKWQISKAADFRREPGQSGISCSLPTPSSMPVTLPSSSKEELHAPWLALPSTLGARTPSTTANHPSGSASASAVSLHSSPLMPQVTDKLPEPTTPAYNMLASFVQRTPAGMSSSTPSSFSSPSVLASLMPKMRPRASSSIAPTMENKPRAKCRSTIDDLRSEPITRSPSAESSSSRRTPKSPLIHRPMTPPIEESSPSGGSSSSSSESLIAKQTVLTLRKILDEQPRVAARSTVSLDAHGKTWKLKAPVFMPVSPPPAPQAGTSNATASISRLFTKSIHTSSIRQPSPARSALKYGTGSRSSLISATQQMQPSASSSSQSSNSAEASTSKTVINGMMNMNINVAKAQLGLLPELLSAGVARAFGTKTSGSTSASTSGGSTPKRISFAELPDMQSSSDGGRRSSRFKQKQARRKKKKRGRKGDEEGVSGDGENDESASGGGYNSSLRDALESGGPSIGGAWWSGWLGGDGEFTGMGGGSHGMYSSRLEDRTSKPWSGAERPGFGLGDWVM